jgi:hypothetical protein
LFLFYPLILLFSILYSHFLPLSFLSKLFRPFPTMVSEIRQLHSPSLSTCNNSKTAEQIFMKFGIWKFY